MCGIAGLYGDFEPELLDRMSRMIAHRGPDGNGEYWDEANRLGLAHRRLAIIDLSDAGRQPMWDKAGRAVIVYNGELYNFRELREGLVRDGFEFNGRSDTEVLLNLYLREGPDMLAKLNGIFAFAIWDPKERELFLARDGIGVKPLYFAETPRGFLFASEMKAILADMTVDRTINLAAIEQYISYLWCPAPRTMLESVQKLEPGWAMMVRQGRVERRWRYYDLPYDRKIERMDAPEAALAVRNAVERAVRRQMVADVPVGAFLSGGLDSSSVAAMALKETEHRLQCFTIGFKDEGMEAEGFINDLPYAQKVAQALGVDLHVVYAGNEASRRLSSMIYHLDEPQADPAPINALLISELAREHGMKVLLSGAGGDDIFTGYRRHYALIQEKYWSWLPRRLRRIMAKAARSAPSGSPLGRRIARAFNMADRSEAERIAGYFRWIHPEDQWELYAEPVRQELERRDPQDPLSVSLSRLPEKTPALNRMLYLEGKHFLADHNLNYTDKMGMAVGVEIRVPLLDLELVDLAARLPVRFKQHGRHGKWIFKRAMEGILPREVIYRPKTGFPAPLRSWMNRELKGEMDDALSDKVLRKRGLFDPEAVRRLRERDRRGLMDVAYPLFAMACIELWCRIFVDSPRPVRP